MKPTSRSEIFNPNMEKGTDELRRKHRVVTEAMDLRSLYTRARVEDQHLIDTLFINKEITAAQHSAGECFMDVIVRSGGTPRSCDPSAVSFGSLRDAERSMSSRIMIASGAFRALSEAGEEASSVTLIVICQQVRNKLDKHMLEFLRKGLNALSRHFGTAGIRDPRMA